MAQQPLPAALQNARDSFPFQNIYLHTDHVAYQPGEMVWFKVYAANDQFKTGLVRGSSVFVDCLDPQGRVVEKRSLLWGTNMAHDAIQLPTDAGGVYTLRAYTNWMLNWGESAFFEKKIYVRTPVKAQLRLKLEVERTFYRPGETVFARFEAMGPDNKPLAGKTCQVKGAFAGAVFAEQTLQTDAEGKADIALPLPTNLVTATDGLLQVFLQHEGLSESVARPIVTTARKQVLAFFPEGGDWHGGYLQRIAFACTDTFNNPLDCRGVVCHERGDTLLHFESFHKGMGVFSLLGEVGTRYRVFLDGQRDTFFLPACTLGDYGLSTVIPTPDSLFATVWAAQPGKVTLALRMGERLYYERVLHMEKGLTAIHLSTDSLPAGLAQLTLFDAALRPHAERLLLLHAERQVQLKVRTDKEKYLPGEQVQVQLSASDETGRPVDGDFSAAVVEDNLWAQLNDKQDNIRSRFLLTAALNGHIDEPAFYFDTTQPKATAALDLVLLTHGWRRFAWKTLLAQNLSWAKHIPYPIRNYVSGVVRNRQWNAPKQAKVWVNGTDRFVYTDKYGLFQLDVTGLDFPLTLKTGRWPTWKQVKVEVPDQEQPRLAPAQTSAAARVKDLSALLREQSQVDLRATATSELLGKVSGLELQECLVTGYATMERADLAAQSIRTSMGTYDAYTQFGDDLYLGNRFSKMELGPDLSVNWRYNWYYGRRVYHQPYRTSQQVDTRSNFQKTVFWAPSIPVRNGQGAFQFRASDEISAFRIIVEGLSQQGLLGHAEQSWYTQLPLSLETRVPAALTFGDTLSLTVRIANRTTQPISGVLTIELPGNKALQTCNGDFSAAPLVIAPQSVKNVVVCLSPGFVAGAAPLRITFTSQTHKDVVQASIRIMPKGFLKELYLSDQAAEKTGVFDLEAPLPGSMEAHFVAYPHLLGETIAGLNAIVREPHGCFEQVTSSNYPNIMALQILDQFGISDYTFRQTAKGYLASGYQKIAGYETPRGGFSLYGQNPPVLRLTAYGLLQLHDLRAVYDGVKPALLERTRRWLLQQQDKKGHFGQDALTHAFTLYALSELKTGQLEAPLAELDTPMQKTTDPYRLAMIACANLNMGRAAAVQQIEHLLALLEQQPLGALKVGETFMLSYGNSQQVEAVAWAALALGKAKRFDDPAYLRLILYLRSQRGGYGGFGSTQATVFALKALQYYAINAANKRQPGELELLVNGASVAQLAYSATQYHKFDVDLQPYFKKGQNTIAIRQKGPNPPIPFTVQANWRSIALPLSHTKGLELKTTLHQEKVNAGSYATLTVQVQNTGSGTAIAPLALIGIPAGLSLQNWQLKDLAERHLFEFFELRDNCLVAYFTNLTPGESRTFQLELKADLSGTFRAPASVVYPYYAEEFKYWTEGVKVEVE